MEPLLRADRQLSEWIQERVGRNRHKWIATLPYYLGLLPYEIYVLPGMFLAILTMLVYETAVPVHFHLLPHWFAFSVALYLKHNVARMRPGCAPRSPAGGLIDPHHCEGGTRMQSFPSGHTIIAASLATTLHMFLRDPSYGNREKTLFDFGGKFAVSLGDDNPGLQRATILAGFLCAAMVGLHRVAYGYHHVSDVLVGAVLGFAIGFASYRVCNRMRNIHAEAAAGSDAKRRVWPAVRALGIGLALLALAHFFAYKLRKLSTLQH